MRVCKSCHNNMITVNCDTPRPLYRPFSNDVTAAILVFTNNEKFSLLESVKIYYHLRNSIWSPRQRFFKATISDKIVDTFHLFYPLFRHCDPFLDS